MIGLHGVMPGQVANMDVYRQLGKVDGEASLQFLLEKYGKGNAFVAYAMAYALTGWMEEDFEGAMAGFQEFVKQPNGFVFTNPNDPFLFQWKGEEFHSGLM